MDEAARNGMRRGNGWTQQPRDGATDRGGLSAISLAVFDLDGTLTLPGTSVLQHVGQQLGFAHAANGLARDHAARTITNAQVSRAAAQLLRDRSRPELRETLHTLPMMSGIGETIDTLAAGGVRCALATITFDFAAEYLTDRFGFVDVLATALEWTPDGRLTGHVRTAREPEDKCCFIRRQCTRLGIAASEVLVVGDTYTDVPAMDMAGWSIGVNPTSDVERIASASVRGTTDLRSILPYLGHQFATSR